MRYFASNVVESFFEPGRYLVLNRINPTFHPLCFPAGKVEFGESPVQAARRELYEETGVTTIESKFLNCADVGEINGNFWVGYFFTVPRWCGLPRIKEPKKFESMEWLTTAELYQRGAVLLADVVSSRHGFKPDASNLFTPYAVTSIEAHLLEELRDGGMNLTDDQLAARLGVAEWCFDKTISGLRQRFKLQTRTDLVKWWEKNRYQP